MLKTPAGRVFAPANDRRIYILWIALVWIGMLGGFVPDIGRYLSETPPPPMILHVHGILYFLWLALVTVQIALVEVRKPALHKRLGWWVVGLSVVLVPLGLVSSMVDMARSAAQPPPYRPEFLALELQSQTVFAILLTLAVRMRRDLAAHRRLMILLLVDFLDPGTSRALSMLVPHIPYTPVGFWFKYFWANALLVLLMMAWDKWRHGRIHPALITGGAIVAAGEAFAVVLEFAPWWHDATVALVRAWGWTG